MHVVSEVLLDDSRTESHRTKNRHVSRSVVGEAEGDVREFLGVGLENVQVHEVGVLNRTGVIRVALHENDVDPGLGEQSHRAAHVLDIGGPRSQKHRLSEFCDHGKLLKPVHVTGTDLEGIDVRVQVFDSLEVIRRRHELDIDLLRVLGERCCPLPGKAGIGVDLEDRLLPTGLM